MSTVATIESNLRQGKGNAEKECKEEKKNKKGSDKNKKTTSPKHKKHPSESENHNKKKQSPRNKDSKDTCTTTIPTTTTSTKQEVAACKQPKEASASPKHQHPQHKHDTEKKPEEECEAKTIDSSKNKNHNHHKEEHLEQVVYRNPEVFLALIHGKCEQLYKDIGAVYKFDHPELCAHQSKLAIAGVHSIENNFLTVDWKLWRYSNNSNDDYRDGANQEVIVYDQYRYKQVLLVAYDHDVQKNNNNNNNGIVKVNFYNEHNTDLIKEVVDGLKALGVLVEKVGVTAEEKEALEKRQKEIRRLEQLKKEEEDRKRKLEKEEEERKRKLEQERRKLPPLILSSSFDEQEYINEQHMCIGGVKLQDLLHHRNHHYNHRPKDETDNNNEDNNALERKYDDNKQHKNNHHHSEEHCKHEKCTRCSSNKSDSSNRSVAVHGGKAEEGKPHRPSTDEVATTTKPVVIPKESEEERRRKWSVKGKAAYKDHRIHSQLWEFYRRIVEYFMPIRSTSQVDPKCKDKCKTQLHSTLFVVNDLYAQFANNFETISHPDLQKAIAHVFPLTFKSPNSSLWIRSHATGKLIELEHPESFAFLAELKYKPDCGFVFHVSTIHHRETSANYELYVASQDEDFVHHLAADIWKYRGGLEKQSAEHGQETKPTGDDKSHIASEHHHHDNKEHDDNDDDDDLTNSTVAESHNKHHTHRHHHNNNSNNNSQNNEDDLF
jgi:hypothetical protein